MKLGFGAIGKGYAPDRWNSSCKPKLEELLHASGDLSAWEHNPWYQLASGVGKSKNKNKVFAWFPIQDKAVVTSGDYERFLIMEGKRYGHIINLNWATQVKAWLAVLFLLQKQSWPMPLRQHFC